MNTWTRNEVNLRKAIRDHQPLIEGKRPWCMCGHKAETIYDRETHLIEVYLEALHDEEKSEPSWLEQWNRHKIDEPTHVSTLKDHGIYCDNCLW